MSLPQIRPYGSWVSPISAADIAAGAVGLSEVRLAGRDVYWIEMRPTEGGRSVVVRWQPGGGAKDCIPPGFNARTRVHEYGGGSYCVAGEALFFANFTDQRVYRIRRG